MMTTQAAMELLVQEEVKGLSNYLDKPDYTNACNDAAMETGFSFPTSTNFQTYWIKMRAKRHLFFYLLTESAHKFKYEQINLQHRFEHYKVLIESMDKLYDKALEDSYLDFSGASTVNVFGTKIDAGFQYDPLTGRDTTYRDSNVTILTPTEND
jgi:hypothetical protein